MSRTEASGGYSWRAASCQWATKARMSSRSIGSSECAVKPWPVSQSSGTAEGRVVTMYRASGKAAMSGLSQVSVRLRSRVGTSSTPSTSTSARPPVSSRSAHPAGAEPCSGTPEARKKSSGRGSSSAVVNARSRRTNGTHTFQSAGSAGKLRRAALSASHCTRVLFSEPAGPRSTTRRAPVRVCSALTGPRPGAVGRPRSSRYGRGVTAADREALSVKLLAQARRVQFQGEEPVRTDLCRRREGGPYRLDRRQPLVLRQPRVGILEPAGQHLRQPVG